MSSNPLLTIWVHPRQTVRAIIEDDPRLYVITLATLAGISQMFGRTTSVGLGAKSPLWTLLLIMVIGPLISLFMLWASSHLIEWTGRSIRGRGTPERLRTALAWGMIPMVLQLIPWITALVFFGADFFATRTMLVDAPWHITFLRSLGVGMWLLSLWSLILSCQAIAEVQRFRSAWWALWNLILAGAIVVIPAMMIVIVIAGAAAGA